MNKAIRLSVIADTKAFQAEMAKIPGVTDKKAAAAAIAWQKQVLKAQNRAAAGAEKAQQRAAYAAEKAEQKALQAAERAAAKKAASQERADARRLLEIEKLAAKKAAAEEKAQAKIAAAAEKAQADAAAAAEKAAEDSAESWRTSSKMIAGAMLAAVAAFGTALIAAGEEVAELRNELGDLSAATGVSVEALSGLRLAAESAGSSMGPLEGSIRAFPKALADVAMGTGEAKIAFDALGLSADDASAMLEDTDAGFREVIARLQAVEGPGERANLAMRAFGESGGALMAALGDTTLEEFTWAAQRFGADVGPEAIESAREWERNTALLSHAMNGAKAGIVDATIGSEAFGEVVRYLIKDFIFLKETVVNVVGSMSALDGVLAVLTGGVSQFGNLREAMEDADISAKLYVQDLDLYNEIAIRAKNTTEEFNKNLENTADNADEAANTISKATDAGKELDRIFSAAFAAQLTAQEAAAVAMAEQLALIDELEIASGDAHAAELARVAVTNKARLDANKELRKIFEAGFAAQLTEAEALTKAYQNQLAQIEALEAAGGDSFEAEAARVAVKAKHEQDLAELEEKLWNERQARIEQTEAEDKQASADRQARTDAEHADKMAKLAEFRDVSLTVANAIADIAIGISEATAEREIEQFEATLERLNRLRDQRREANEEWKEGWEAIGERKKEIDAMTSERARAAAQEQLEADIRLYRDAETLETALQGRKIENTKKRMEDQRKSARQAAKAAKQAALLGVAVNTSAAILQAFALFGPPPSPAGIASAASATAAGIFQAAAIRRQKLPTAHSGEFIQPDETIRKVRAGEAVLNQRAAADLGGRQGIDALNRGSGTGSIVIQSVVDGRVVSEAVARQLARRSGTIDQIMRQGRRPLGQLSPYGG